MYWSFYGNLSLKKETNKIQKELRAISPCKKLVQSLVTSVKSCVFWYISFCADAWQSVTSKTIIKYIQRNSSRSFTQMVISQKLGVWTWFWHQIKAESMFLAMCLGLCNLWKRRFINVRCYVMLYQKTNNQISFWMSLFPFFVGVHHICLETQFLEQRKQIPSITGRERDTKERLKKDAKKYHYLIACKKSDSIF